MSILHQVCFQIQAGGIMGLKILIKGAGDLATGVAAELKERGHQIVMTEIEVPLSVRRQVSCSRAVYEKKVRIEQHEAVLVKNREEIETAWKSGQIAVIIDPEAKIREIVKPDVVVDGIMAKKNLGTSIEDASCVIALGPGFTAGEDCHAVIETKRGETLGCPIYQGSAIPNTGVPGMIGGYAIERLIKAAGAGKMKPVANIADAVKKGDLLAYTGEKPVYAAIDGIIRGMLQEGVQVEEGMKIGDVDPRTDVSLVYQISDKARKIGQGVAEAIREIAFQRFGMVFLAAGKSSRYGENKLLAERNKKPMYRYLLDQMKSFPMCKKVVVSRFEEILEYARANGMLTAENEIPEAGISFSLQMGLRKLQKEQTDLQGVLFSVCDQPDLKAETIERILEKAFQNPRKIICAGTEGQMGNPVIMDQVYFEELLELEGDVGGRQVIKKHPDQVLICETEKVELKDIDRITDW